MFNLTNGYYSTKISISIKKEGLTYGTKKKDLDDAVSDSIENQKAVVLDYISEHPEFDMRQIYIDDGYSGMNFNRPGLSGRASTFTASE